MKKIFLSLLILFSVHTFSQDSKAIINKLAKQAFVDMNNRDYDAILEMTHPKIFEFVSKKSMKVFIESMFEGNEEFSIEIPKLIPKYKMSEIFSVPEDNLEYAFISYNMKMKMTFYDQTFDEETKKVMISMMKMKDMDVSFISDNSMDVFMKNRITIFVKDDTTKNKWAMINYDEDSVFFHKVLPESLLQEAKKYKQNLMTENKN